MALLGSLWVMISVGDDDDVVVVVEDSRDALLPLAEMESSQLLRESQSLAKN